MNMIHKKVKNLKVNNLLGISLLLIFSNSVDGQNINPNILTNLCDSPCKTGSVFTYFASGKLRGCGPQVNSGKWQYYTESGKLEALEIYSKTHQDSVLITYFEDGKVRNISIFENGKKRFGTTFDSISNLREFDDFFNDSLVRIMIFRQDKSLERINVETYGSYNDFFKPKEYGILKFDEIGILKWWEINVYK